MFPIPFRSRFNVGQCRQSGAEPHFCRCVGGLSRRLRRRFHHVVRQTELRLQIIRNRKIPPHRQVIRNGLVNRSELLPNAAAGIFVRRIPRLTQNVEDPYRGQNPGKVLAEVFRGFVLLTVVRKPRIKRFRDDGVGVIRLHVVRCKLRCAVVFMKIVRRFTACLRKIFVHLQKV